MVATLRSDLNRVYRQTQNWERGLILLDYDGTLVYLENTSEPGGTPSFRERPGDSSPVDGVDVGFFSIPTFAEKHAQFQKVSFRMNPQLQS